MRRRFSLFLIVCLTAIIAILLLLLSLFGVLNPADSKLEHSLTQQLDYSFDRITRNMDQLAAYAVDFSKEMTVQINAMNIPFDSLRNNPEALTELQYKTYTTVLSNMKLADCSGAFFMLNTTVNDSLNDTYYSGIYLKYANIGSVLIITLLSVLMCIDLSHRYVKPLLKSMEKIKKSSTTIMRIYLK